MKHPKICKTCMDEKHDFKKADPFLIGIKFLEFCLHRGWIVELSETCCSTDFFITKNGEKELNKYGIKI